MPLCCRTGESLERSSSPGSAARPRAILRALPFLCLGAFVFFFPGQGRADERRFAFARTAEAGAHAPFARALPGTRTSALDRLAFAVEGAESSYGTNPGMWRANPSGPQGPMQVSAAAAADVGGGDRFDPRQNFALGRAYLRLMYRRFGSWPDAIAAYNWGPGRLDAWIRGGRVFGRLPPEVALYRDRVFFGPAFAGRALRARERGGFERRLGIVHAQPRPSRLAPLSPANRRAVLALYGAVMAASAKSAR